MTKRCDTCLYWHLPAFGAHMENTVLLGECRIGPPERASGRYDTGDPSRGRWPLTLPDDFCHAHQTKPEGEA
jgi:hypothetical protein